MWECFGRRNGRSLASAPFADLHLVAEAFCRSSFGSGGYFFPVPGRSSRIERLKKAHRHRRDIFNSRLKHFFVGFGRFVKTADLTDELQRSGAHLIGRNGWIEIKECFDVPAHSEIKVAEISAGCRTSRFRGRGFLYVSAPGKAAAIGQSPARASLSVAQASLRGGRDGWR